MKEIKQVIILGIIMLLVKLCVAQTAPGYMGKKLIIEYSVTGAPALFRINKNGKSGIDIFPPDFKLPMNYGHKLTGSYSINRKSAYGASLELFTTGVDYSNITLGKGVIENNRITQINGHNAQNDAVLNTYGLTLFKSFYRNGISPLGRHTNIGIKILYASTDLSQVNFSSFTNTNNNQTEVLVYDLSGKSPSSIEWGFTYGMGVNRILFDKVVINFGFEVVLMFSALNAWGEDWRGQYDFTDYTGVEEGRFSPNTFNKKLSSDTELFKKLGSERVFTSQFFNLKIGIGFLAH